MESSTEQSQSQQVPLSLDQSLPESQSLDLDQSLLESDQADSLTAESTETEVETSADHVETEGYTDDTRAVSDEEVATIEEQIEETQAPSWDGVDFSDSNTIDDSWLPEDSREHFKSFLNAYGQHHQAERNQFEESKQRFEAAEADFRDLIGRLDDSSAEDGFKELGSQVAQQNDHISSMTTDLVNVSWRAFDALHPEMGKIPDQLREEFATSLEDPKFFDKYGGDTLIDKMEEAYRFAAFRTGVDLNRFTGSGMGKMVAPPETVVQTKRQGIIADGALATGQPTRSVDDMSWDELRERHAHLLDDLRVD